VGEALDLQVRVIVAGGDQGLVEFAQAGEVVLVLRAAENLDAQVSFDLAEVLLKLAGAVSGLARAWKSGRLVDYGYASSSPSSGL